MTALILPFPDFFRPASPRDEMGVVVDLPTIRIERKAREPWRMAWEPRERECPKVQELRRQSKMLREHFKRQNLQGKHHD